MFDKSLLARLIYFLLVLGALMEFNIENNHLEIGIVRVPSFPPIKSNSTLGVLLKYCLLWEVFLNISLQYRTCPVL